MSIEQNHKKCRQWKFKVDKDKFTTESPCITGKDVLELAGKIPVEQYLLILSGHGQPQEISLDQKVDLSQPGIELFKTLQRECREGFQGRKDFQLPPDDSKFLDNMNLKWETIKEGGVMRLVLYDYPIPENYNVSLVDIYLRIEPNYPDTQIDMFYVFPALSLKSGKPIKALATDSFDTKAWQRWSRHRVPPNVWRPGLDCIETHLALVNRCLKNEGE